MKNNNPHLQQINKIPLICAALGMKNVIISPGSRSAPLTVAFARCEAIVDRVVIDERSAAYIALGIAQQTNEPVGLICTSGTAALNYMPAVAEAYYQHIPLLLLTADRPPEWINQRDNQTVHQRNIYASHSRGNFELPVETEHFDAQWHLERTLSEALKQTRHPIAGPVHINIPLREPLYDSANDRIKDEVLTPPKVIHCLTTENHLDKETKMALQKQWQQSTSILMIVGMNKPDNKLCQLLKTLAAHKKVVVIADVTANLYPEGISIKYADIILAAKNKAMLELLSPDLLITLGGQVVSKSFKSFLRQYKPTVHWHIDEYGEMVDTYQTLTSVIPVSPVYFFSDMVNKTVIEQQEDNSLSVDYSKQWHDLNEKIHYRILDFIETVPFSDIKVMSLILNQLPAESHLQLGNSMIIRYANVLGYPHQTILSSIHSNRGTSGIDGTVSTAVGAALTTDEITTLITGDLAFFYDRNALWNDVLPNNLRIIVINNHGGGIFDLIDGPNQLSPDEKKRYFLTPQTLTAQSIATDYGCHYKHCRTVNELENALDGFFAKNAVSPAILEVETNPVINQDVWKSFKANVFI